MHFIFKLNSYDSVKYKIIVLCLYTLLIVFVKNIIPEMEKNHQTYQVHVSTEEQKLMKRKNSLAQKILYPARVTESQDIPRMPSQEFLLSFSIPSKSASCFQRILT